MVFATNSIAKQPRHMQMIIVAKTPHMYMEMMGAAIIPVVEVIVIAKKAVIAIEINA